MTDILKEKIKSQKVLAETLQKEFAEKINDFFAIEQVIIHFYNGNDAELDKFEADADEIKYLLLDLPWQTAHDWDYIRHQIKQFAPEKLDEFAQMFGKKINQAYYAKRAKETLIDAKNLLTKMKKVQYALEILEA